MILEFLAIFFIITACIDLFLRSRGHRGPRTDHFNGRHFFNLTVGRHHFNSHSNSLTGMIIFSLKKLDSKVWEKRPLPQGQVVPAPRVFGKEIVSTHVGHSTVLIQTEGLNILTDPVWAEYASPFPYLGPRRYMDPGIALDKLPEIDIVLLTHNHYDHLDLQALRHIAGTHHPVIYTTLGNRLYLARHGIHDAVEMDWGDSKKYSDLISIDCVPAQHFSARSITDRNKTLWAGFVIRTPHGDIYFAGDTGYGPCISRIRAMYPQGFRLAYLPIGAFEPRSFMKPVHADPDDAIQMYKDLGAERAVAIHWGTFDLALDGQDEPAETLRKLLEREENRDVHFETPASGERREFR